MWSVSPCPMSWPICRHSWGQCHSAVWPKSRVFFLWLGPNRYPASWLSPMWGCVTHHQTAGSQNHGPSGSVFALCLLVVAFLFLLNSRGWTCAKIWWNPPKPSRSHREGKTPPPKNMAHVWVCRMHMRWIYCSAGLSATPSGSVSCSVTRVFLWQKVCHSSAGEKHNQQQQQKITKSKQVFLLNLHALKPFLWTFTIQHSVHWQWMSSSGFKRWEQCCALKSLNWKFLAFHLFSHSREKTSHKTFLCA